MPVVRRCCKGMMALALVFFVLNRYGAILKMVVCFVPKVEELVPLQALGDRILA